MNSAAIIYARTNSSRFPRKCFAQLSKDRLLLIKWVILRAAALNVECLVFATTNDQTDDELVCSVREFEAPKFKIIRGSENNLIQRTLDCLSDVKARNFVRINGDSPFFPVDEINGALEIINKNSDLKFISNLVRRTYPYGVAVEVMDSEYYIKHSSMALEEELEHTTLHLYRLAAERIIHVRNPIEQQAFSLTIDTKEDFSRLNSIIENRELNYSSNWRLAL